VGTKSGFGSTTLGGEFGTPKFDVVTALASGAVAGGNAPGNLGVNLKYLNASYFRWLERVANYSPWNDVFSMEEQKTSLVVDIPFENRYLFIPWCLGFAWVDGGRLKRINPIRHPWWQWMRACRVEHQGVRYFGNKVYLSGSYYPSSGGVSNASNETAGIGVANYKLARFKIDFANYPWDFLEDNEVGVADEWQRNVYWSESPTAQMLAAEGGAATLKFRTNDAGGEPANGQPFRAAFGTIVPQIKYTLNWMWVPFDFVAPLQLPANLYTAIFKCNDAESFGTFPKGTLLFEPPVIEKYVYPIRTLRYVSYMANIKIPFTYMDPERGITEGAKGAVRGHNLMPSRINNKWYPATRDNSDDFDTKSLFPYTDATQIFQQPT